MTPTNVFQFEREHDAKLLRLRREGRTRKEIADVFGIDEERVKQRIATLNLKPLDAGARSTKRPSKEAVEAALYDNTTVAEAGFLLGVTADTVTNLRRLYGIPANKLTNRGCWTDEKLNEAKRLWAEKLTCTEIGERLGISPSTVCRKLEQLGVRERLKVRNPDLSTGVRLVGQPPPDDTDDEFLEQRESRARPEPSKPPRDLAAALERACQALDERLALDGIVFDDRFAFAIPPPPEPETSDMDIGAESVPEPAVESATSGELPERAERLREVLDARYGFVAVQPERLLPVDHTPP